MKTIEERKEIAQNFIKGLGEKTNAKVIADAKVWAKENKVRIYGIDDRGGYITINEDGSITNDMKGSKSIWRAIAEISK